MAVFMTPQMKQVLLLGSVLLVAIASAVVVTLISARLNDRIHAPIYAMQTGELIVDYMRANNGRWPTRWDDIGQYVAADRHEWFAEVRKHVDIDFDFDPASVDTTIDRHRHGVPIHPVSIRNGTALDHDNYPDPNVIIFDYLKSQAKSVPLVTGR